MATAVYRVTLTTEGDNVPSPDLLEIELIESKEFEGVEVLAEDITEFDGALHLVQQARNTIRSDEPLPEWTWDQWLAAISVQSGRAAEELSSINEGRDTTIGRQILASVVAVILDALEARK